MTDLKIYQSQGEKQDLQIIAIIWISLQVLFFIKFGVIEDFEAAKYITEAEKLISTGTYSSGNFLFYSVQILLIAFSKLTGTYPAFPIIIQMAVNAISVYLFYKLSLSFTLSRRRSLIFTIVFLAMYYYHLYNVHLFTESLFFSFGIIYSYYLFSLKRINLNYLLFLFIGLLILYFTRPTGIYFIPATLIYLILKFYKRSAFLILSIMGLAGAFAIFYLLNFALKSGGEFDFLLPYKYEMIICGVPTIHDQNEIILPVEGNSIQGLFYVITNHTSLFLKLALKRLVAFWGIVRPFYSMPHNIFIAAYFYSVYLMIFSKTKILFTNHLEKTIFFLTLILLISTTVALSCDEWHNRFILALLPFFLLMASANKKHLIP
jgi:hypothetical protein